MINYEWTIFLLWGRVIYYMAKLNLEVDNIITLYDNIQYLGR